MNLTDEQLNIAICEWRGWKEVERVTLLGVFKRWFWPQGGIDEDHAVVHLPSYITGPEALGNIHEAEQGLSDDQRWEYMNKLEAYGNESVSDMWTCTCATARQRAIALLRVVKPEMFE